MTNAWLEVRRNDDESFVSAYRIDVSDVDGQEMRRIELVATFHEKADGRIGVVRISTDNSNGRVTFKDIYTASSRMARECGCPGEVVIKASADPDGRCAVCFETSGHPLHVIDDEPNSGTHRFVPQK